MDAEMTRISWLEKVERKKKTVLKISLLGLIFVLGGILFNENVADFGWALSFISMFLWVSLLISQSLLSERCPFFEVE